MPQPDSAAAEPDAGGYLAIIESYAAFPALLTPRPDFRPALALSFFGGLLGLDRFRDGRHITGVLKLLTAGGLGLWWVADIITILTGRADGREGRGYSGTRKQYAIAWVIFAVLFGGGVTAGVIAAAPAGAVAAQTINETIFPVPEPVQAWEPLAVVGPAGPATLEVTGTRLRFNYNFPAPVYAYLQDVATGESKPLLLKEAAAYGTKELPVEPGQYAVVVRTEGTGWTISTDQLTIR